MIHLFRSVLICIVFLPIQTHPSVAETLFAAIYGEWVTICVTDRFDDKKKFCSVKHTKENELDGYVGVEYSSLDKFFAGIGLKTMEEPDLEIDVGSLGVTSLAMAEEYEIEKAILRVDNGKIFELKDGSDVTLTHASVSISGQMKNQIVRLLKKGNTLYVRTHHRNGLQTDRSYPLRGFTTAYEKFLELRRQYFD